jgi:N-formylglutamate deformylase
LNIGTATGASAHPGITEAVAVAAGSSGYSSVVNGRFKGGYITRRYGDPAARVHAIQLEMCQATYMQEKPPFRYEPALAHQVQPVLKAMLESALAAAKALHA